MLLENDGKKEEHWDWASLTLWWCIHMQKNVLPSVYIRTVFISFLSKLLLEITSTFHKSQRKKKTDWLWHDFWRGVQLNFRNNNWNSPFDDEGESVSSRSMQQNQNCDTRIATVDSNGKKSLKILSTADLNTPEVWFS